MSRQNPLPPRPGFTGASSGSAPSSSRGGGGRGGPRGRGRGGSARGRSSNTSTNSNTNANTNASYNPAATMANASGGYPAGGYPYMNYSYGYGYDASGGYGGYAAAAAGGYYPYAGYGYYPGYNYPAQATPAAAPAPASAAAASAPAAAPTGMQAWRNCSYPGCKYTGPGDLVEQHEGDRHLIFPNGKGVERSEEEERFLATMAKTGIKPTIQGTGIRLETDEDIAKWIEERKRKWPTKKRVEEREQENADALARGENPRKKPRLDPARAAEEWGREVGPPPSRGKGRERGRGRGAGMMGDRAERRAPVAAAESTESAAAAAAPAEPKVKKEAGAGLVAYSSDASDTESTSSSSSSDSSSDSDSDSDSGSDGSEGQGNEEEDDAIPSSVIPSSTTTTPAKPAAAKDTRPVCNFFLRGKCRHGAKCRYRHERPKDDENADKDREDERRKPAAAAGPPKPPPPRQPAPKRANPFVRPSMLGALLANPIQNTLSQLTQTIRFLVANDMLRNVETRAGEAEEQARARNKVVLVQDVDEAGGEAKPEIKAEGDGAVAVKAEADGDEVKAAVTETPA